MLLRKKKLLKGSANKDVINVFMGHSLRLLIAQFGNLWGKQFVKKNGSPHRHIMKIRVRNKLLYLVVLEYLRYRSI